MTTYAVVSDAETAAGQPAFGSVMRRQRDNLKALAEGDASVPVGERLTNGSFKPMTVGTAVIAQQPYAQVYGDDNASPQVFFQATVVVAGVYTFSGTRSTTSENNVKIYVNGTLAHTATVAGFTYDMTLASGDRIRVDLEHSLSAGDSMTMSNFALKSINAPPMAYCQFHMFTAVTGAS